MFKISAKTDYGLLIMLELARYSGQIVPLSPLAKVLKVSSPYLSQVARSLQKADLIKSREGAGGGYYLARSPEDIKILEVLEALSGKIKVRCAHSSNKACPHFQNCGLKSAWPLLLGDIKKSLDKRSLASLLVK
ncbi:Rrf2 family transcriptional regulator [Patescibacteria group bacterium]|nr:Rrf2 family transcriptional regulator [Patescibacteria group bacterium]